MKKYAVSFKRSASKELGGLPAEIAERIFKRIEALADDPRPGGCKKLTGGDSEWRIRVGEYRVVFTIDDREARIEVTRIRHRREAYD